MTEGASAVQDDVVLSQSIPTQPQYSYSAKLITQSLDALSPLIQGNPDRLLTLAEFPRIALEAPSPSGGKFWIGAAMETGITIRWGKSGTAGTMKHIPISQCNQNNPVLELKHRSLNKISKGYDLIPHETKLP